MAADQTFKIEGGAIKLPPEIAARLEQAGHPLRLVFNTPRLLALVAGSPMPTQGREAHPALAGDLSRLGLPDLFGLISMTQKSGLLFLMSGEREVSVFFERGEIVFASSNAQEDRLGDFLYRRGLIEKKQLQEAEKAHKPGTRFGKVFVEMGVLQPKQLWEAVRAQVEEIVYSIFSLRSGEFIFIDGAGLLADDLSEFSLSSQNLIMEGIRRSDEMAMIEEVIPNDSAIARKRDQTPNTELSESEKQVLALVDGKKNVRQLIRASKRGDFDGKRILYDLAKAKFIEIREPGETAQQDPKARMAQAIGDYNKVFAQLYSDLKTYAKRIDVNTALAQFFEDLSGSRFADVFAGVALLVDGRLDADKLLANIDHMQKSTSGSTLAIAGLNDLLNYELLVDALNEFLNFEIFTVRNSCEDAAAAQIVKKVRQVQSGLIS